MSGDPVVCRIEVTNFAVEVVPSNGAASTEEWNAFSVQAQRDAMPDTRQMSRWISLHDAKPRTTTDNSESGGGGVDFNGLLTRLEFSPCNLASFLVQFRKMSSVSATAVDYINCELTSGRLPKVYPKANHPLLLSVIARHFTSDENKNSSFFNESDGPLTRIRSFKTGDSFSSPGTKDTKVGKYGQFVCQLSVDPSEAYNSPTGRLEYRLLVQDQDTTRGASREHLPGTPRYLCFTVVARREVVAPARLLRNFHDTCVLVDQFILDVTESKRDPSTAYGFGFFTDVTEGTSSKRLTNYTRSLRVAEVAEDGHSRIIDFSKLLPSSPKSASSGSTVSIRNPIDVVIASSESVAFNNMLVGCRVVATSRFKTDEYTGLCKTSLKAMFVVALLSRDVRDPSGGFASEAANDHAIDLAKEVLNQECFPTDGVVRSVPFAYGERLYFRIRRRCFEGPNHYNTPLLTPAPQMNSNGGGSFTPASPKEASAVDSPLQKDDVPSPHRAVTSARSTSPQPVFHRFSPVEPQS